MKQSTPVRRHRKRKLSALQMVAGIWVLMLVAVVITIFWAPDKPEAPPASTLSYQEKPENPPPLSSSPALSYAKSDEPRPEVTRAPKESESFDYAIQGTVTEKRTGKPIVGANIFYKRYYTKQEHLAPEDELTGDEGRSFNAKTDEKGHYSLRVPLPGPFRFSVHANNYITFIDDTSSLAEGEYKLTKDVALSNGAQISGRVTEAGSGRGAPDVEVTVNVMHGYNAWAKTDGNGDYTLGGLKPDTVEVSINTSKVPYLPVGKEATRSVTIKRPDEEVKNVNFTVDIAGQVWGYVVTQKKEPVHGVDLILCDGTSPFSQLVKAGVQMRPPANASSKTDGYYEIMGVPLDKEWRLYAATEKTAPQLTSPFLLTPSHRSARVDIYLQPGTTVFGRVISTDGSAIEGAEILCLPGYSKLFSPLDAAHAFRPTRSKEDGSFEIENLPMGDYQILARKDKYKFAAQGEPISPNGHTDIHGIEVVLTPVGEGDGVVYGKVTDAQGQPLQDARLSLASMSAEDMSGDSMETTTDAKGEYAFYGIKAGFLLLTAECGGYQGKNVSNVRIDEPTDIMLDSTSYVSGTVVIKETGEAPDYFTIHVRKDAGDESVEDSLERMFNAYDDRSFNGDGRYGAEGRFEMFLAPGEYTLEARSPGLTPGRTQVSVSPGRNVEGVRIEVSQAGGHIRGRVITADGTGAAGALVWLTGGESDFSNFSGLEQFAPGQRNIQVGADGTFEFERLPAGTYTVMAKLEGYAQSRSNPVMLKDGQTVSDVQVVLTGGGSLQGTVEFDGELAAGALVTVTGGGFTDVATSDDTGHYRMDGIPAGEYLASAVNLNGNPMMGMVAPMLGRVEIREGEVTTHNFGEPTHTALTGLCTPPPPAGVYGFAVLMPPGTQIDPRTINFMNPLSMLQGAGSSIQYGMTTIAPDGYFRIDNLAEGNYTLLIVYAGMGDIMSSNIRPAYVGPVRITSGQTADVNISVSY